MSKEEAKKLQIENSIKDPVDLNQYFAPFLECETEDIEIKLEESQQAVHKEINLKFFFQGITSDPELVKLKDQLAESIREFFREEKSTFISVVELRDAKQKDK
jgi:hypothetical protein